MRKRHPDPFECIDHYEVVKLGVGGATEKDVLDDPVTGDRYIAKLGGRNSDLEVMTESIICSSQDVI